MNEKLKDIKFSLPQMLSIMSIVFAAAVFYTRVNYTENKIDDRVDGIKTEIELLRSFANTQFENMKKDFEADHVVIENRLKNKIEIINKQDKTINDLENRIIILETIIKLTKN